MDRGYKVSHQNVIPIRIPVTPSWDPVIIPESGMVQLQVTLQPVREDKRPVRGSCHPLEAGGTLCHGVAPLSNKPEHEVALKMPTLLIQVRRLGGGKVWHTA